MNANFVLLLLLMLLLLSICRFILFLLSSVCVVDVRSIVTVSDSLGSCCGDFLMLV